MRRNPKLGGQTELPSLPLRAIWKAPSWTNSNRGRRIRETCAGFFRRANLLFDDCRAI